MHTRLDMVPTFDNGSFARYRPFDERELVYGGARNVVQTERRERRHCGVTRARAAKSFGPRLAPWRP